MVSSLFRTLDLADWFSMDEAYNGPDFRLYHEPEKDVLTASLPGYSENDIIIENTGDVLTISGKLEKNDKNKYFHTIKTSQFTKSYNLSAQRYDLDNISAELKNGILTVFLPKLKAAKIESKKIPLLKS